MGIINDSNINGPSSHSPTAPPFSKMAQLAQSPTNATTEEKMTKMEGNTTKTYSASLAAAEVADYTPEDEKRINRKIDFHLVPVLTVLYLMSYLDRGNSEYILLFTTKYRRYRQLEADMQCQPWQWATRPSSVSRRTFI